MERAEIVNLCETLCEKHDYNEEIYKSLKKEADYYIRKAQLEEEFFDNIED